MEETFNFSNTQRIVFLIDLHPLINLEKPKPYISSILSASQTLLTFQSLSSSLFTYKFFISSLSPLLSSSKLRSLFGKSSPFFSFDRPSETLISLTETLNSLNTLTSQILISPPKASLTASSICQLMHDHIWEPRGQDLLGNVNSSLVVRSNLIIVFSPVSRSMGCLANFIDLEMEEELLGIDVDVVSENFVKIFGSVNEGLVSRDIHCSWIDVNYESESVVEKTVGKERSLLVFERGIKSLGWGFSSTDAFILGSALVPFGMIYPIIGCSLMNFCPTNDGKKARAEMSLSITDVSGKPLECNCCDLELLDLRHMSIKQRHSDILGLWESSCSSVTECSQKNKFRENQNTKVCVKEVWRNVEDLKLKDCFNGYVLLRGSYLEHRADELANTDGFFADKVLEMLCVETSEFASGKPIWPIFLNFLYRHKYWALVSISSEDGDSLMGILKPFTVHSAFVCIIDRSTSANNHDLEKFSSSLVEIVKMDSVVMPSANVNLNQSIKSTLSQNEALFDKKSLKFQDGKKKIHRKNTKFLQNLSWSSFCEAVLGHSKMDLEEVYFNRECNKSKKMKFLKCWMKQTMKSSRWFEIKPIGLKSDPVNEELKGRLVGSEQENDQPVSSSFSTEEPSLNGEVIPVSCLETPEAFFSTISQKIQQGLESKELDLGAFAERLVGSSICLLCLKYEKENLVMNSTLVVQEEDCGKMVVAELVKLLLREPKDLAMKYKGVNPQSSASDLSSSFHTSEHKVREYELQILFRMEILRSKVQGDVKDPGKKKMVKQICLLLDDIQYHLEGGCFGDVNLEKYVERTIKKRYSRCLGGVVDRIYAKMDLLLCCDDDGAHVFQINSDGDKARRQKVVDDETGENASCSASTSASVPIDLKESNSSSSLEIRDENHKCGLKEAQERRERASRFSSFTRRGQYLQRVWAPKQSKAMSGKTDTLSKIPKRKAGRGARCDVVCETPMTEKKRSCIRDGNDNGKQIGFGIKLSGSVSKALFQDDNTNTSAR